MGAEGRAGDDHEAVGGEAGDGEVTFYAAAGVQHLSVDHRAGGFIDIVITERLQEVTCAGTEDFDLGKGCLVEERGGFARGARLGGDSRGPVVERPACEIR